MTEQLLSIGEVADAVDVSVSALRYYDKIGLISSEARVGGQRRFLPDTIGRVSFVQRAKDAGFSLGEITAILDDDSGQWSKLVDGKLEDLRERHTRLAVMIELLERVRDCGCSAAAECPKFDAVSP